MAASYISVPRDLTKVKSKVMFNLTKRQLICFGLAALAGVPSFFLLKLAFSISTSVMIMMVIMMPFFFLAMYEKHGQPLEVFLKHFIQANFVRPKTRPYGISRSHIMEMAKKAGAVYKVGNTALINTEIFEAYLEQFKENPVPLPKYIVDKTKLNK